MVAVEATRTGTDHRKLVYGTTAAEDPQRLDLLFRHGRARLFRTADVPADLTRVGLLRRSVQL